MPKRPNIGVDSASNNEETKRQKYDNTLETISCDASNSSEDEVNCLGIYYATSAFNETSAKTTVAPTSSASSIELADNASTINGSWNAADVFGTASSLSANQPGDNGKNEVIAEQRKPVKLTMKQGLIMNQVISTYALSNVRNSLCAEHVEEFKVGLRAFEPWALQMFDSSSKVPAGVLDGNLFEYGAFQQCLNIYKNTKQGRQPIRGRHCSLEVTPTERLLRIILGYRNVSEKRFNLLTKSVMQDVKLTWSVCVPESCHAEDVLPHFNRSIQDLTEGLNLTVSLEEDQCFSLADQSPLDAMDYLFISIIVLIVCVCSIASVIDYANQSKQKSSGAVVASLSLISNSKRLFSTTPHVGNMDCLHSLRYLSICWVVVGHRYIHNMVYPSYNSIQMIYWVQEYFSTLVMGGTVSVDTFFLISSVLLSYSFFQQVEKRNKINIFHMYLYRYMRLTPPLIIAAAGHATVLKHFGSGPRWIRFCKSFQTPCQKYLWSTVFHIQTYVNPHALCIVPVWSVADDMLFFYCSPILLVPLWKSPIYGKLNWLLLYIFSIFVSFWVAWTKEYDGSMPITPRLLDLEYFHKHYVAPHTRASPYILGLLFGYSLHKTKNHPVKISPAVAFVGWTFAIFSISSVVLIAHMFHMEDYVYNRMFSSLFLSCSRSVWTAGLIWMVFACMNNCGGAVNFILTLPMFRVLGRLTYSISLLHFGFQAATMAAGKNPPHFSNFVVIFMAISDIVIMTAVAVPFALFFEYPTTGLVMGLLRKDAEEKQKPNRIDFKP